MGDYIISCCSTADLTEEHFRERDISYICFHYELDGVQYADDLGKSMGFEEFYKKMTLGADTKTSQVNLEEFREYFEPFLKEGKDILHLCLSSGISGVLNSALAAKQELENFIRTEKFMWSIPWGLLQDMALLWISWLIYGTAEWE